MLTGLRRIINSTAGKVVALAILVVIAIAFAASDMSGISSHSGVSSGAVAEVENDQVTEAELVARAKTSVAAVRRNNPNVDMSQFLAAGALENLLDRMIDSFAFEHFARKMGMAVTDKQVDSEIAGIQAFQGIDGKFSQQQYESRLAENGTDPATFHDDVRRDIMSRWLIDPVLKANQVPMNLALPYASLLLERREGQVAYVPIAAVGPGAPPTDADIQKFFAAHKAGYTIPERRVMRYAAVDPSFVAAQSVPTDAEIAAAYKGAGKRFAPNEARTIEQVVVLDQKGAEAIAAKVRAGASIGDAAKAAGLEATTLTDTDRAAYVTQAGEAVAAPVFAAKAGDLVGPTRGAIGWYIARVASVKPIAGKSLDQARAELTGELQTSKASDALFALQDKINTGINNSATFDELIKDGRLKPLKTGPLLNNGVDFNDLKSQPTPMNVNLAKAGFGSAQGDAPQLISTGQDGSFAVVLLDSVIAAAPPPLAQIRERVARDFAADRALLKARQIAAGIVARVSKGESLEAAGAATNLRLPTIEKFSASRADLARQMQQQQQLPAPVQLLFNMSERTAKLTPADGNGGYFIVYLTKIDRTSAVGNVPLIQASQSALGTVVGNELTEQLVKAIERDIGVKRNPDALKRVRDELGGTAGATP